MAKNMGFLKTKALLSNWERFEFSSILISHKIKLKFDATTFENDKFHIGIMFQLKKDFDHLSTNVNIFLKKARLKCLIKTCGS